MNEIMSIDISSDIVKHPENYSDEMVAAATLNIKEIINQAYEAKKRLENHIIKRMDEDDATKLYFNDSTGRELVATLRSGSVECKEKNIDQIFEQIGFQPIEIGDYVFKPSWTKAKEAAKVGGEKKILIEKYFKSGEKKLVIDEVKK